jgi:uncharacterized protein (TIGR02996 family)
MEQEQAFLQAMLEAPRDLALRLIFADWLEENGDSRGELLRLSHLLTQDPDLPNRMQLEDRLRSLLEAGVQSVGPFWTNTIGMRFAWIPPGVFLMGSPSTEGSRLPNEVLHRVRLSRGLWLGVHPVTGAQWQAVMGSPPSEGEGRKRPAVGDGPLMVSWLECQELCAALAKQDGRRYALPTEAEWEYACRAGTTTPFHFGAVLNGTQANCDGNRPYGASQRGSYRGGPSVVGSYRPNAFGLHDMHGNLWEWCQDSYAYSLSTPGEIKDPVYLEEQTGAPRVIRGGCWHSASASCRAARRDWERPSNNHDVGCRVCFRLD